MFWHHYTSSGGPKAVLRDGRWKLVSYWDGPEILRKDSATMRPGDQALIRSAKPIRFELYELETDPGERPDVPAEHPQILTALRDEMQTLRGDIQQPEMGWSKSW